MVKSEINPAQLMRVIKKLSLKERNKLLKALQKDLNKLRMKVALADIKKRRLKLDLTDKEIAEEIDTARKDFYDRRH